jgi:hypothetical protein
MIGLGLKLLLGGWGRLLSALTALWGWVTKNPTAALCVLLAASTVWFWRSDRKHVGERDVARLALKIYARDVVKAQADAKAAADASDKANVTTQITRNDRLETDYAALDSARSRAVAEYIRMHPAVRCRSASSAAQAGVHPDPAEPADSAETAGLVTVTPGDLDSLAAGAMHGAKCTGFLNTLIAEGLAVPAN